MIELHPNRKNKINLEDYDYKKDIQHRLFLSTLSVFDIKVLEEILYSPLKVSLRKLSRDLDISSEVLYSVLEKLNVSELFTIENEYLIVDKESRKYYEFHISRFDEDFKSDMEFLFGLLKQVPIHVLPIWYSIPRTSNNIFESIVEKYLITPQLYQRYFMELGYNDSVFSGIIEDVFHAPQFYIQATELMEKYDLSRDLFEEYILHLEFNFICSMKYVNITGEWEAIVTPFYEWQQYLEFQKNKIPDPIQDTSRILRKRPSNFAFIEEISKILKELQVAPLHLSSEKDLYKMATLLDLQDSDFFKKYFHEIVSKIEQIKLLEINSDTIQATEHADEWLEMSIENRALYLYRHPLNKLQSSSFDKEIYVERMQREAEKSIRFVIDHGWVLFDDFIKGAIVPLTQEKKVLLTQKGKNWRYTIPEYSQTEQLFIKTALFEGLFHAGMVSTGTIDEKDCFCVTPFGQTFFGS